MWCSLVVAGLLWGLGLALAPSTLHSSTGRMGQPLGRPALYGLTPQDQGGGGGGGVAHNGPSQAQSQVQRRQAQGASFARYLNQTLEAGRAQQQKGRTRPESSREQRRRCRRRGACRGRQWCPDVDVGNRAYLAPTVFEGKARSMSSLRKPGSNYAVTFEVRHVYKSQPGFVPLQKNDSVRLHFRDKSSLPPGSSVCNVRQSGAAAGGGGVVGAASASADGASFDSGVGGVANSQVVRANIKRGKVYLVFVNRVGPRNFTILGEPVIRSKKNEQAVQAVIRPDYGE
ncbi:hypothetical protein QAD02_005835 [Eretmocerus hayati]|uniref:Uncharacterized protein n=1 Tax=Eretmocerus hayati TaxID=131215 RepID=A0ACC2NTN1_9HYME|nr:hypothetical protein QAD02_005835 [Eretmocerus hayati]